MNSLENINIKLIQGLNLLSQAEFNKFLLFSSSKYYTGEREYSKLLESLKEIHNSGFSGFNNKTLISYLEGKLKMNKNTILNRMSELYKIYEKYIINEMINYNKDKKTILLLNYYLDKKSSKLFDYVLNSYNSDLSKELLDSERIETEYKLTELSAIKEFKSAKYILFKEHFSKKSDYQVYSFIIRLLKENIEFMQQRFSGSSPDSELSDLVLENLPIDRIINKIKNYRSDLYLLATLYYKMYLSFIDFSVQVHFKQARKIHAKIKKDLSRTENQQIYTLFVTYCIDQTNLDKRQEFYIYLFEIIDMKLQEGYFDELKIPNDPVNNFRDYVLIGIKVNKFDWVRKFISGYSSFLPLKNRQDDINIANGLLAISENRFEEALQILNKVKKKNYIHYIDSSFYRLRAFYELELYYDAFREIDNIKEYFSGNKNIPVYYLKNYSAVLNEITLLFKFTEKKSGYDNLLMYCKKNNFNLSSSWVSDEVKKIFNV